MTVFGLAGCNAATGDSDDEVDEPKEGEPSEERTGTASPDSEDDEAGATESASRGTLEYGATYEGSMTEDSDTDPDGDLGQPVTFEGAADGIVVVGMSAERFDPYVVLEGPNGAVVARNDNGGAGSDSLLRTTLAQDGTYTIWATSTDGDQVGSFSVSLSEGDDRTGERSIDYGETIEGWIVVANGTVPNGDRRAQPVVFDGGAGDTVTISMTSDQMDPYLFLETPAGDMVAENDDGGEGRNSEVTTTLEYSGEYTIWASNYNGFGDAPFTLSLDTGDQSTVDSTAGPLRPW